ncbi:hypothetical protein A1D22_10555 [Pasteurellaceae bacterium LFhippo2]|nr:hypothetical protein [Pasteurellaceae bacterium LFhippo2]
MKKITSKILFTALVAFGVSSMASAQITSADKGIYKGNAGTFRMTPAGKSWTVDLQQKGKWERLACGNGKACRFTPTGTATLKRFFAKNPDLVQVVNGKVPGTKVQCVDSSLFAFCRLDDSQRKTHFIIDRQGNASILSKAG